MEKNTKQLNRKEKRYNLYSKNRTALDIIYKKDENNELILDSNKMPITIAYLHPTKGWKGNKKYIISNNLNKRKHIITGRNK